jgi:hypothetical protein
MKRIDEDFLIDILEGRTALKKSKKKDLDDAVEDGEYDSNVPNSEELPDGPPQAGRTPPNKDTANMDAEDTLEAVSKNAVMSQAMQQVDKVGQVGQAARELEKRRKAQRAAATLKPDVDPNEDIKEEEDEEEKAGDPGTFTAPPRLGPLDKKKKPVRNSAGATPEEWAKAKRDANNPEKVKKAFATVKKADADDAARDAYLSGRSSVDPNAKTSDAALRAKKKVRDNEMRKKAADDARARNAKANEMSEPGKIDASKKNGDWIQKAVNPKNKGACTPMTKETCTPARKALAKRFKKAGRKGKKEGGTGWQGKV